MIMAILYHTTGIILAKHDWREADRFYSLLTKQDGKVEMIGRGAQKTLAKLAPHLEFCAEAEFLVVRGRTYQTIAGVERVRTFPGIYSDFSKMLLAHQALALVDGGVREGQADQILYERVVHWLECLNKAPSCGPERAAFLLAGFALRLLEQLGYRPELIKCLSCRVEIQEGLFRWHTLKGGVVCEKCTIQDAEQWFSARPISDESLKLVRLALHGTFSDLLRVRIPGHTLPAFHEVVESLMYTHFPTIPVVSLRGICTMC
ncbi:MAG: repair protein RecO protein [Candidatus Uhrbacteria bacterium GW2011_GWF2_41_16]|uniref:DNA repair protein RecO n=2 Tax=Candidatus Uhriibacteriota TaxID=1752732 RepID=A0A0G0VFU4_9BACT|nr:MAG: repair protein RecO protein [Candidatus Uhrbacteria bacterium GW2011_GWA2_41_10]KKR87541.1 MAG: repair protein RecO protein [Candidatus Uhrbacteria bacterium GW2011_GWC2_41_11]KKR98521.1 MAG: repair protein RecO protein [Candidatus Uhrbacteria bacterium GW2011_GWF2_41_16]HBO99942.1 DNA repair protein RecO [Candidatus Uhrbacteria bacterium]